MLPHFRSLVHSKREGLDLIIFGGSAHPVLTGRIAEFVGQPVGQVSVDRFPDGEIFVKIAENIRGQDVFIVQPTSPPNDNLLELLIMIDAAKRASADRITAVMSVAFIAVPSFVVALYLLLWLAVQWRWFPAIGAGDSGDFVDQGTDLDSAFFDTAELVLKLGRNLRAVLNTFHRAFDQL